MTLGELALYYNGEHGLGCDLAVIPAENWKEAYKKLEIEVIPVGDVQAILREVFLAEGATLSEGMEYLKEKGIS